MPLRACPDDVPDPRAELVHATAVARWCPGYGWRAVLIRGPSGAGKSDLALRLLDRGWRLVGDDYVELSVSDEGLHVTGPATIRDQIEMRGLGLLVQPGLRVGRVALVVQLLAGSAERMPEPQVQSLLGRDLPRLDLDPRPASAPLAIEAALSRCLNG